MMPDFAVTKLSGQQGQRVLSKDGVEEWRLPLDGLNRITAFVTETWKFKGT
jgi:hypothetical protein